MKTLQVINPADGSVLAEQPVDSPDRVAAVVAAAQRAQPEWAAQSLQTRLQIVSRFRAAVQGEGRSAHGLACAAAGVAAAGRRSLAARRR